MQIVERLGLHRIATQITGIVATSVLLGVALAIAATVLLFGHGPTSPSARIGQIAQLAQAARSQADIDVIVALARRSGIEVAQVPLAKLEPPGGSGMATPSGLIARQLESGWGIDVIEGVASPGAPNPLIVRVDGATALVFAPPAGTSLWHLVLAPAALTLVIILVFVMLLSVYAVRRIIAPLSAVAAAAHSFGRSPGNDRIIARKGPREIVEVAEALDEMRTRIRSLLDDRTRMLAAISHDLRTPLTRLRLRVERVADRSLQAGMLREIVQIGRMLDETLEYLRQDARSEQMSRVDLPSLLQTICTDFADAGHDVSYRGPARLAWPCRPGALARAVGNVVANGVEHGTVVTVELMAADDGAAEIDVSDDGPGIPAAHRDRVFEPFHKVDDARAAVNSGFGLGLSIAGSVVKGHGGGIDLRERHPHGLTVHIRLPPLRRRV